VRVDRPDVALDARYAIDARQAAPEILRLRDEAGAGDEGAEIREHLHAKRQELAVPAERELSLEKHVAGPLSLMKASEREDIQCTGRPTLRAASMSAAYSGYAPDFMPKAPPTSSVITRSFCG